MSLPRIATLLSLLNVLLTSCATTTPLAVNCPSPPSAPPSALAAPQMTEFLKQYETSRSVLEQRLQSADQQLETSRIEAVKALQQPTQTQTR